MTLTFVAVSRQLLAFFMILLVLTQEMLAMPLVTRPSTDVGVGTQVDTKFMEKKEMVPPQSSSESQEKVEEESMELDNIQAQESKPILRNKRSVISCQQLDSQKSCKEEFSRCEWSEMNRNCYQALPIFDPVTLQLV